MLNEELKHRKTKLALNSGREFFLIYYSLFRNNFTNSKKINPTSSIMFSDSFKEIKSTKLKHQMLTINLTWALK